MSRQPAACNDCGRYKQHIRHGLCWSCKAGVDLKYPDAESRIEDVEWMTAHGEHPERIAQRVGMSLAGLDRLLRRHGRADLLHNMKASA